MRAWQGLIHAHHDVIRALDRDLQDSHDLSLAEYDVLLRLARTPDGLRMSDLAERVLMSPSGLTRLVGRLEGQRLVEREADPEDGRVARASLTAEGRRRLRDAARTHLRGIRDHFTGLLSDSQLRGIASALEVITGPHPEH